MACILAVDVEAVGTTVDLRRAHFNKLDQALLQPALLDIGLDPLHRAHRVGCRLIGVRPSSFHGTLHVSETRAKLSDATSEIYSRRFGRRKTANSLLGAIAIEG